MDDVFYVGLGLTHSLLYYTNKIEIDENTEKENKRNQNPFLNKYSQGKSVVNITFAHTIHPFTYPSNNIIYLPYVWIKYLKQNMHHI